MKYIALVLLVVSLQGCLYQSVNETELSIAYEFCKQKNSKVVKISSHALGRIVVVCYNHKRGYVDL